MHNPPRIHPRQNPLKIPRAQNNGRSASPPRKTPAITRRALEKSGFPASLDREIEEMDKTERLLASHFPEVFG